MKKRNASTKILLLIILMSICIVAEVGFLVYSREHYSKSSTTALTDDSKGNEIQKEELLENNSNTNEMTRVDSLKFKILMIDDDETNQRVVDRFEKLGCDVTTEPYYESRFLDDYDALIIPGGGNITPSVYGEERSEFTSDTNMEKDRTQIDAALAFADAGKPVFGICRGCQLINVAFGGTLNQGNGVYHKGWHMVNINSDSLFYPYFGDSVEAYHYHKQRIDKVAEGFIVTQTAADNSSIIEAIEHEYLPIYGLQWHCDAIKMHEDGEKACQAFIDVLDATYK